VHIISRKALFEAAKRLSGSEKQFDAWFRIAKKAEWKSLEDVRKTYRSADGVTVGETTYTVFNIGGNAFRLVVKIEYKYQKIFIKHVLTHAEYDQGGWKK
jgi:mRNA interferase HigB